MLSAVRAMASRVAHDLAHMDTARGSARTPPPRSRTSCSPRCSRTRSRRPRRRSSAAPSSWRSCASPGVVDAGAYGLTVIVAGCLAALRGKAAPELEHQYAPGRPPPARARVVELPLLHELRGHRREPRRRPFTPAARGARRLRARGRATTARCACTSTPTIPMPPWRCSSRWARSRASTWPTCTSRWPDRTRAPGRRRRAAAAPTCAVVAVASGAGVQPALRGAGRARGRRRPDDEPVDLRAARRHPRGAPAPRSWCCPTAPT